MSDVLLFLITLAAAAVGGLAAFRFKLPAGGMIGAMGAVIILNLLTESAFFYADLKIVLQLVSGAMIGCGISKKDILELRKIIWPTAILIVCMVILNLSFGVAIFAFSKLDAATALFATAPGGVSDMALISTDLGANPAYVAILQLFRILIILSFMPPIFKNVIGRMKKNAEPGIPEKTDSPAITAEQPKIKSYPTRLLVALLFAAAIGLLFQSIGITAGALIGGMFGTTFSSLLFGKVSFPPKLKLGLQIFAGAFIGIRMDRASLNEIPELIIPILIMLVGVLLFVFGTSILMHKLTGLPLSTCMLASTPGGLQEMALLADDLGADTTKVTIMQTARLMIVITFFPSMLAFVTKLFT